MELLKNQFYNPLFYQQLAETTKQVYVELDKKTFLQAFDSYSELELMDRLKQVADVLYEFLPGNYLQKLTYILALGSKITGFQGMSLPHFVQKYGLQHESESLKALHYLTRFSSSEFAIRPFIKQNPENTFKHLYLWATDDNNHVRRLASEGSRPLLPWSFKLDDVIKTPDLTFPILHKLQRENDLYVKKSVGNHLNDISKNHPQRVIDEVKQWDLNHPDSLWMAKKGVRTLIKNGFSPAFAIMGFDALPAYRITAFELQTNIVKMGQELGFSFSIASTHPHDQRLNIDYQIYYLKNNGKHQAKVFKLKELSLAAGQTITISKKQVFQDYTTRKHYMGNHFLSLLVNGKESEKQEFLLEGYS